MIRLLLYIILQFEWKSFLFGEEDWTFIFNIAVRTFVMFLVIVISLRLLGKRGIKQLSVFELGVIIGLGSAAGDPMFYRDVGIVACLVVFIVVVLLYHLLKYLADKNEKLGDLIEGTPVTIIDNGRIAYKILESETVSKAELFTQLRLRNVTHLGQIREAILEPNSEISVYFLPDDDVQAGLPILPRLFDQHSKKVADGDYACIRCGLVRTMNQQQAHACEACTNSLWVKSISERRFT